jgi:hypothetical protein
MQSIKVDEARMALTDSEAACRAQFPAVTRQTAVDRAACISDAERTTLLPVSGDFADLVSQRIAYRNALAENIAKGQLSPAQAQYSFAKYNAALSNQAHARPASTTEAKATVEEVFPNDQAAAEGVAEATKASYGPPPVLE